MDLSVWLVYPYIIFWNLEPSLHYEPFDFWVANSKRLRKRWMAETADCRWATIEFADDSAYPFRGVVRKLDVSPDLQVLPGLFGQESCAWPGISRCVSWFVGTSLPWILKVMIRCDPSKRGGCRQAQCRDIAAWWADPKHPSACFDHLHFIL